MKILMIANGMDIGGAETHVLELCTALSEKGHSLIVASPLVLTPKNYEKEELPSKRSVHMTARSFRLLSNFRIFFVLAVVLPRMFCMHTRVRVHYALF